MSRDCAAADHVIADRNGRRASSVAVVQSRCSSRTLRSILRSGTRRLTGLSPAKTPRRADGAPTSGSSPDVPGLGAAVLMATSEPRVAKPARPRIPTGSRVGAACPHSLSPDLDRICVRFPVLRTIVVRPHWIRLRPPAHAHDPDRIHLRSRSRPHDLDRIHIRSRSCPRLHSPLSPPSIVVASTPPGAPMYDTPPARTTPPACATALGRRLHAAR